MLDDATFNRTITATKNFLTITMMGFGAAMTQIVGDLGAVIGGAFGGDVEAMRAEIRAKLDANVLKDVAETRAGIKINDPEQLAAFREKIPPEQIAKLDAIFANRPTGLRPLTEELSDEEIAAYFVAANNDDPKVAPLIQEVMAWFQQTQSMVGA